MIGTCCHSESTDSWIFATHFSNRCHRTTMNFKATDSWCKATKIDIREFPSLPLVHSPLEQLLAQSLEISGELAPFKMEPLVQG